MKKKKFLSLMVAGALLFNIAGLSAQAAGKGSADHVNVVVNGYDLTMDVPAFIQNGRTLVPIRAITEAFGASIKWDEATQLVTITSGNYVVKLTIGSKVATITNTTTNFSLDVDLDAPAQIVNGRTLVPLRFVSETFGSNVTWDATNYTAQIKRDQTTIPSKETLDNFLKNFNAQHVKVNNAIDTAYNIQVNYQSKAISYDQFLTQMKPAVADLNAAVNDLKNLQAQTPNNPFLKQYTHDLLEISELTYSYYEKSLRFLSAESGNIDQQLLSEIASINKLIKEKVDAYNKKFAQFNM